MEFSRVSAILLWMKILSKTKPVPLGAAGHRSHHRGAKSKSLPSERLAGDAPSSNSKWSWHQKALLSLRDRLQQSQSGIREGSSQPPEQHSVDQADSATDEFDLELAVSLASSQQDLLYEIDEALARIKNGKYGICESTGKAIPSARLKAVPWTRFTAEAQKVLERSGETRNPRLGALGSVHGDVTGDLERSHFAIGEQAEQERATPGASANSNSEEPSE
jgi:RNA polymerase-binding protein DksA